MSIIKKDYELSVWYDLEVNGAFIEKKKVIIGSSSMEFKGKANLPILVTNLNGTKTLTFTLPEKYYDEIEEKFIHNYLIDQVTNETKIKLKKENKWYTFIVKSISEVKTKKQIMYSYTCQDIFINELSKIGWDKNFSDEIGNNYDTLTNLANKVLEDTTWKLGVVQDGEEISEDLVHSVNPTSYNLVGKTITPINKGTKTTIAATDKVYVFYSDYTSLAKIKQCQILVFNNTKTYNNGEKIEVNQSNYLINTTFLSSLGQLKNWNNKANKIIQNPLIFWDKYENRYVNKYKKGTNEFYGYEVTKFASPLNIKNLTVNSSGMVDDTGWSYSPTSTKLTIGDYTNGVVNYYLNFAKLNSNSIGKITNTGLVGNKYKLLPQKAYLVKLDFTSVGSSLVDFKIFAEDGTTELGTITSIQSGEYYALITKNIIDKPYNGNLTIIPNAAVTSIKITNFEFFEAYRKDGDIVNSGIVNINDFYSLTIDINDYNPIKDLVIYDSITKELKDRTYYINDNTYQLVYDVENKKQRSLTEGKSNVFNLLQKLNELFSTWITYDIAYKANGEIDYSVLNPKKVNFYNKLSSNNNAAGFVYGINLDAITRNIVSDNITTKLYVEPVDSEFSPSGTCSIELADDNISKELFLVNFDYYINKGMLDYTTVLNDLYGTNSTDLAYLTKLGQYNKDYDSNFEALTPLYETKMNLNNKLTLTLASITELNSTIENLEKVLNKYLNPSDKRDEDLKSLQVAKDKLANSISIRNGLETNIAAIDTKIETFENANETIINNKKILNQKFMDKYSRFIQEGVWSDENYVNSDLYYYDAKLTQSQSAMPQVSYEMTVIDVSVLEGYENYNYQVGDVSYIEDTEFFGYFPNSTIPYREIVIVSEIEENLDSPINNKITIQNYNSQFEELFQRITNATQTLEFNKNFYDRSATNFTANKEINTDTLQNSLLNNSLILANSKDQSVIVNDKGIEVSDLFNMSDKVRISSRGVFLSQDGGKTWGVGIKGSGINASYIVAGQIDVSKINIMNGNFPGFSWDKYGLTAFGIGVGNTINTSKFVRYDQYGLYFINGIPAKDFENSLYNNSIVDKIGYIQDNANASFTWDGFNLKTNNGAVSISTNDDIQVFGNEEDYQYYSSLVKYTTWVDSQGNITAPTQQIYVKVIIEGIETYQKVIYVSYNKTTGKISIKDDEASTPYLVDEVYENISGWKLVKTTDPIQKIKIGLIDSIENFHRLDPSGVNSSPIFTKNIYGLKLDGSIINEDGTFSAKNILTMSDEGKLELNGYIKIFGGNSDITFGRQNENEVFSILNINNEGQDVFTINNLGEFTAKKATIEGKIIATEGIFSGEINAKDGLFSGQVGIGKIDEITKKYNNYIDGGDNAEYLLKLDEAFKVTNNGNLIATSVDLTGTIKAIAGEIAGKMFIGKKTEQENNVIVLDGTTGSIYDEKKNFEIRKEGIIANSITLGTGAKIAKYLEFDINTHIFTKECTEKGSNGNDFIKTLMTSLDYNGKLTSQSLDIISGTVSNKLYVGSSNNGIVINGKDNPYISSSDIGINGWKISNDGRAVFNNVYIRGEIATSVFKYDEIQTASGTILVAPSSLIENIEDNANYTFNNTYFSFSGVNSAAPESYLFTFKDNSIFNSDLYCFIKIVDPTTLIAKEEYIYLIEKSGNKMVGVFINSIDNTINATTKKKAIITKTLTLDQLNLFKNKVLTQLGSESSAIDSEGNLIIGINSTNNNSIASKKAISMYNFEKLNNIDGKLSVSQRQRLIIGSLPIIPAFDGLYNTGEFGLFCDNILANGALISQYGGYTSGINTKNSLTNKPVIWAGATGDVNTANFKVFNDGTVQALEGIFKGTIEADSLKIIGGWLNGENGLSVTGGQSGIKFYSSKDSGTLSVEIKELGLKLWNGADLEVYDLNSSTIPYLFTEDMTNSLTSKNIFITNLKNDTLNGITMTENGLSYKKNVKKILNSDTTVNRQNSLIEFNGSQAISSIEFDKNNALVLSYGNSNIKISANGVEIPSLSTAVYETKELRLNENAILKAVFDDQNINIGYDLIIK